MALSCFIEKMDEKAIEWFLLHEKVLKTQLTEIKTRDWLKNHITVLKKMSMKDMILLSLYQQVIILIMIDAGSCF